MIEAVKKARLQKAVARNTNCIGGKLRRVSKHSFTKLEEQHSQRVDAAHIARRIRVLPEEVLAITR